MNKLNIGTHVEKFVEWLSKIGEPVFHQMTKLIEFSVDTLQSLLLAVSPFLIIAVLTVIMFLLKCRGSKLSFNKTRLKETLGLPLFCLLGLLLIYWMGFWQEAIDTLVLVLVSTVIILMIGIPLGIWCAKQSKVNFIVRPLLDFMQTMPAFVYLIPAILFFSVGNVPGVIATIIFSLPPAVRMTSLGIKEVPPQIVEASVAFGCTSTQTLFKVQIPLAMPTILAGVNQVIMLALSMVVISSMVGAGGLGESVYTGILQANIALGFEAGLCVVILAIILDRATQSLGKKNK
ncbi:ABC transporter permease [Neisseria sp. Ec49-e6-T10]|uniref:ABC transporter permease n=1 Tax=Neisseria sp. Ec49-e6-T10 TaxID=3140744 RepID=UPI003EB717DF